MRDIILRCTECGNAFVLTTAEQSPDAPPVPRCPMCRKLAPADGRRRGLVKWFSRARGFGFIVPVTEAGTTAGPELFVHRSGVAEGQPLPREGQLVEFAEGRGPRGPQAESVVVLEGIDINDG